GLRNHSEDPWYVVGKDLEKNVLIVAQGNDHPALFSPGLIASQVAWINEQAPTLPMACTAKIRYRQQDQACEVSLVTPERPDQVAVQFNVAQRAVTPGQAIVFYQGDVCLGGGVIEHYVR
ncbi:MAG: tRNA 2-thiouridine(34) synthase MnmA, partial [Pseudohongiella sp.]|nr:tRNA 2-thiouridine(34) synthase MnmA [Pseudohongiella sp.]